MTASRQTASTAPIAPRITASSTNGQRMKPSVAPTSFMICTSRRREKTERRIVLEISRIEAMIRRAASSPIITLTTRVAVRIFSVFDLEEPTDSIEGSTVAVPPPGVEGCSAETRAIEAPGFSGVMRNVSGSGLEPSRAKGSTVAQPLVGDSNGVAKAYWDGLYKIVVMNAAETVTLHTWDNFDLTEAEHRLEGTLVWNPGNLVDGAGETSSGITVTGAAFGDFVDVAAPYDLQGITVTAYVSASDTVKIRAQNETGGAIDLASGTWRVRIRRQ